MPIKKLTVSFDFPFSPVKLSAEWEPDEHERKAAWELYVELATRVTIVELRPDVGLVREALASFYSVFDTTRSILREYGPSIARPGKGGTISFGQLAVVILNECLRPVMSKWHPLLADWESQRPPNVSTLQHERAWVHQDEVREALEKTRVELNRYAGYLATVADVPILTEPPR